MNIIKEIAVGVGAVLLVGNSVNALIIIATEVRSKKERRK